MHLRLLLVMAASAPRAGVGVPPPLPCVRALVGSYRQTREQDASAALTSCRPRAQDEQQTLGPERRGKQHGAARRGAALQEGVLGARAARGWDPVALWGARGLLCWAGVGGHLGPGWGRQSKQEREHGGGVAVQGQTGRIWGGVRMTAPAPGKVTAWPHETTF